MYAMTENQSNVFYHLQLFLIKNMNPDVTNVTQELSRFKEKKWWIRKMWISWNTTRTFKLYKLLTYILNFS